MEKSVVNQISPSQVSGRLATWHRVMEEAGLTYEDLQTPIDDPEMRKKLVAFWKSGGFESTTSQKRAREILPVFGIEKAIKHFKIKPTAKELSVLAEIPFPESVLQECKDTHILVAVFPISIIKIRDKVKHDLFYSHEDAWYNKQSFAKELGNVSWQLIRKTPVVDSTFKNWSEQRSLLTKDEETPSAQVMVYTIIGYYLSTGERLFEKVYVRTSSVGSDGGHVNVGDFDSDGLDVSGCWDGLRYDDLGVSSARKI
ncbi:MAG: hypothetical protein PHH83_03280 [Patescibacteria group bacterium]|nr:hypothetical protein [Patescibacteria group bacterium]